MIRIKGQGSQRRGRPLLSFSRLCKTRVSIISNKADPIVYGLGALTTRTLRVSLPVFFIPCGIIFGLSMTSFLETS